MEKELDVIIEEGLKKIVEDKINEQIDNIDFHEIANQVVADKFKNELSELTLPKISSKMSIKQLLDYIEENRGERYSFRDKDGMGMFLRGIVEEGVSNFLERKLDIHWTESSFFGSNNNLEVKDKILTDSTYNSKFVKYIKSFFDK